MIIFDPDKAPEMDSVGEDKKLKDVFQLYYFGHPGSEFYDKQIMDGRIDAGHSLVDYYGFQDGEMVIPNPDSGWGVTIGVQEAMILLLKDKTFDFSKLESEGILKVKDRDAYELLDKMSTTYPALIKQAQAVRTFQEPTMDARYSQVGLKFGCVDSLLEGKIIDMGDDSIVRGSVSEGGSMWGVKNANVKGVNFWISYGPMIFPSFKGWKKGKKSLDELAVHKAFKKFGGNPYDASIEEINHAVAKMNDIRRVLYNPIDRVQAIGGDASYQALDASYPIDHKFWPHWLKTEVDKFHRYNGANNQKAL